MNTDDFWSLIERAQQVAAPQNEASMMEALFWELTKLPDREFFGWYRLQQAFMQLADTPKLAEGLPELCYSVHKSTGELIVIKRGECGYHQTDYSTEDKERNIELADYNNERLGVTPIQRRAMELGSICGWDVPGADPAKYMAPLQRQNGGMTFE